MTTTREYGRLLRAICTPADARVITAEPWLVTFSEQTFAAATDGARALYVATGAAGIDAEAEHLQYLYEYCFQPHLANLLSKAPEPTHQIDRGALLAAIGPGDLVTWVINPCRRCEGSGKVAVDGGARRRDDALLYTCHACDGQGKMCQRSDSGDCDPLQIGGMPAPIDAHLLRGIFEHLPGDTILLSVFPTNIDTVVFHGPGWVLLIACLRHRNNEPVRIIETTPIQPANAGASA